MEKVKISLPDGDAQSSAMPQANAESSARPERSTESFAKPEGDAESHAVPEGDKKAYVPPVVESITVCIESGFAASIPGNYGRPGGDGTLDPNDLGNY